MKENVLYMRTYLCDEFGTLCLTTAAGLSPTQSIIIQQPEGEAFNSTILMDVKIREMYHFLSILKLFDPQFNTRENGIPEIVSQTPSEPWETE